MRIMFSKKGKFGIVTLTYYKSLVAIEMFLCSSRMNMIFNHFMRIYQTRITKKSYANSVKSSA